MGRHILVVDDDLDLLEAVRDLLELDGYVVEAARDGMEALERLRDRLPDLIVLDLMMPRMSGYELMEELERQQLRQQLRIVVLTADAQAQHKAERIHADAGVVKPFEASDLLTCIAALMERPNEP